MPSPSARVKDCPAWPCAENQCGKQQWKSHGPATCPHPSSAGLLWPCSPQGAAPGRWHHRVTRWHLCMQQLGGGFKRDGARGEGERWWHRPRAVTVWRGPFSPVPDPGWPGRELWDKRTASRREGWRPRCCSDTSVPPWVVSSMAKSCSLSAALHPAHPRFGKEDKTSSCRRDPLMAFAQSWSRKELTPRTPQS